MATGLKPRSVAEPSDAAVAARFPVERQRPTPEMGNGRDYDAIIVGGGFFGCALAAEMHHRERARVALLEAGPSLLRRASYANQARVHNGYHYPRSILTGLRSRVNFPRFAADFADCVVDDFEAYYAVARHFSKVTAQQFRTFSARIGAPLSPAPARVRSLFSPQYVEEIFEVREFAFDANALRKHMVGILEEAAADVYLDTEALRVESLTGDLLAVRCAREGESFPLTARRVFNCTYSRLNRLLQSSGLRTLPLKHEVTELSLVEVPEVLRNLAITVMCGPFFSLMPFPPRGLHSLSHVRYTPHDQWVDQPDEPCRDPDQQLALPRRSNFIRMLYDAQRYVPALAQCQHVDSLWEVKTVLPSAERDDGRPILFATDPALPGLVTVMGGKVDNIYDVLEYEATRRGERVA